MACEVKTFGTIRDFKKVQEFFGLTHDDNWLNAVNYAISPTGELIALAQGEKLALLTSCYDNKNQAISYALNWCGELENPNQIITSIICLPISGKGASTGPEWTCVVLGLSSGMLHFYTDAGIKIFSQSYHEDPVLCIKSYTPPHNSESDSFLYIIYDQCICIIKGSDILPLLSNQRHNISRTLGRKHGIASNVSGLETADTTPYQKFNFARERETLVNDAVIVGAQKPCTFDHIVEQCLGSGYYAKFSEHSAQRSLVLGVGAEPYLGFYFAEEGYRTITLGEVAKDVLGMAYKNILGNLFRLSPTETTPPSSESNTVAPTPTPTKEAQMRARCRFYDGKRDGFTIVLAPNQRLAAITDNLHRIMLVDCDRGVTLRMWKGYRDAQCAFIPVKERTLKHVQTSRRRALFLAIYAPRMGCLEIWALQYGPKVAAFTVSKSGQLVYNMHGLLGAKSGSSKTKASTNYCLFLDPSDGSVKEILIPFHYALGESNSKTSRDIHQLRRLKNMLRLKVAAENLAEIRALAAEFQTIAVRQQCLEMLKKNKQLKPLVFHAIIDAFSQTLDIEEDTEHLVEKQQFQQLLENYKRLVDFYIAMSDPVAAEFDAWLEFSDSDLVTINQLVLLLSSKHQSNKASNAANKVTFQEQCNDDGDFVDYLSIFQIDLADKVPLLQSKTEMYGYISGRLFGAFFERGLCFEQFKHAAEQSKIPCEDLLRLALHYWITKPFEYNNCDEVIADMSRLAEVIRAICELAGDIVNDYAYNAISPWWQKVREILLESQKSLGLLVAIVCKTVAAQLRRSYWEGSCDEGSQTEEEEHWEQISHDEAQWGLLIGKLEDISILGAILEYPLTSAEPIMPELPYMTPDCSLHAIVSGGKGIVTDLTAQWLINSRIHPTKIVEQSTNKLKDNESKTAETTKIVEGDENKINAESDTITSTEPADLVPNDPVLDKLSLLREHFPFSLESGVLLSLMSWQYMVHWSKNLPSLQYMRAALTCLEEFQPSDYALKHGMCCMLWNATLKYPLQATMKLIQKVGRLPGEKMCQQDIEMSASLVADFLELVVEFMQQFSNSLHHDKRELKFEESLAQGQLALQFLALQQHNAIKELLILHTQLCNVLHFIAFFQIKISKPMTTLFDAMSNKAFFHDINKELSFVLPAPDLVLQQLREDFLCKVITASMDLIREDLEQLYVLEHNQYMERINNLADSWKLDKSSLKRQQIVEMYAHGYDTHGEILLKKIPDDEEIGCMLLEIAGRRLMLYSKSSSRLFMKIASVGQQLLYYTDNLQKTTPKSILITASEPNEIDIVALTELVRLSLEFLSKRETKHVHIAAQMFDACCVLQEK